ncbi:MAG: flagellar hook basal-body protein [Planctomycetota bacterium]
MEKVGQLIAGRLRGLARDLDTVASNMANSHTPGFKKRVCSFTASAPEGGRALEQGEARPLLEPGTEVSVDHSSGELRRTGRNLDVAIKGEGYFVVQTADGRRYTRRGRFYRSSGGRLVDFEGRPVLASGGTLEIPQDAGRIRITSSGRVMADGRELGRLTVVNVEESSRLEPESGGLFRYTGNDRPTRATGATILQGAVEESNVEPVKQMVKLLRTSRQYQQQTRMLKQLGDTRRELVNTLL